MAEARRRALVIASSEFRDETLQKLVTPDRDVQALARVLSDPAVGDFEVTTLTNELSHALKVEILRFFDAAASDDLLLLYFSGHGIRDDHGNLYLATLDTHRCLLKATTVEAKWVNEVMTDSHSRRQVLILDCCYSGAFEPGVPIKGDDTVAVKECFGGRGRVVIAASNRLQPALQGRSLSIFTHHLVHGLHSGDADRDGDGEIAVDELFDYVADHMRREKVPQSPRKWELEIEGDILIAHNRSGPHPDRELEVKYTKAMGELTSGRWENGLCLLQGIAAEAPRYRDVGERMAALIELERGLRRFGPAPHGWRRMVLRFPMTAILLAAALPNMLSALFNYQYNWLAIIEPKRDPALSALYDRVALIVNSVGFSVGLGTFAFVAWPVARGLARLRTHELTSVDSLARLRTRCVNLGHYAAVIGVITWALAGPAWVFSLQLRGNDSVYFLVSLTFGGLIAAVYPFFAATFLCTRVWYSPLIQPGTSEQDQRQLNRFSQLLWRYLASAGSIPILVITLPLLTNTLSQPKMLGVLGLGSLVGLALSFWACRTIQTDLEVLQQAVSRSQIPSDAAIRQTKSSPSLWRGWLGR